MPDSQKKRGQHPSDAALFAAKQVPILKEAVNDFSWLKTRGYADDSSLKLVGDRYQQTTRQRTAVIRSSCSDEALRSRKEREIGPSKIYDKNVYIDGFNLLITIETILGGGVLLFGRDGCLRDMSSMHGSYRMLADSERAISMIDDFLSDLNPKSLKWLLDKPVSNSGRLKSRILEICENVEVELLPDPDPVLKEIVGDENVIITADSGILNESGQWFNAARFIFESIDFNSDAIVVNLSEKVYPVH